MQPVNVSESGLAVDTPDLHSPSDGKGFPFPPAQPYSFHDPSLLPHRPSTSKIDICPKQIDVMESAWFPLFC